MPPTSGPIHYVTIEDGISDADLHTTIGEEVRWVNIRSAPVAVIFPGLVIDDRSCKRGFAKDETARVAAIIPPDEHASLWFSHSGHKTYRVLDVQRPGVELNHAADVQIIDAG